MQTVRNHRAVFVQPGLLARLLGGACWIDVPEPSQERSRPVTTERRLPVDLPDFAAILDTEVKKQTFFDFLQPFIDAKNAEIWQQRQRLFALVDKMTAGYVLSTDEREFLVQLGHDYELPTEDLNDPEFLATLQLRVDVLPPSLVLAQAANESAWGTSRFALEGYNFFGQWCYREGCGLVPDARGPDASHEVQAFGSVGEAVDAYFANLNTFASYQSLREIRQDMRASQQPIDGLTLAEGLGSYSERGPEYISELREMIRFNELYTRDLELQN